MSRSQQPPAERVVDGLRVLHQELPYGDEDFTSAVLTFGVGSSDETLPMLGVGHLLEHLSLWPVRDTPVELDGTVELQSTSFAARGRSDDVARVLQQICASVSALPVQQIQHESGVLEAEDGSGVHPLVALLFNLRFGNQGPGLLALPEPDPTRFTGPSVQAFANRWFVPANAFVHVVGRLPRELSFPLPQGPAPVRPSLLPTSGAGPAATFDEAFEGVGLIIDLPLDTERPPVALCLDLLERRLLEETRFAGGYSYSVQRESFSSPTEVSAAFALDARPGVWRDVAERVFTSIRALAADGPSKDELAWAVEAERQRRMSPEAAHEQAWRNGLHQLMSWPPASDVGDGPMATPDEVAAVFAGALRSVIVCGPPEAADARPDHWSDAVARTEVATLPPGRHFRPGPLAQLLSSEARQASVVLATDGIGQELEGARRFLRWNDVNGVLDDPEERMMVIHGPDGTTIDVGHHYRHGSVLLQAVRERVDQELFYRPWHTESEGEHDD